MHQQRQVIASSTTRTSRTSCSPRSARATRTATAATCGSSSSARAPATTPPWRASNWSSAPGPRESVDAGRLPGLPRRWPRAGRQAQAGRRLRRHRLPRLRRAARRRAPWPACWRRRSRRCCATQPDADLRRADRRRRARLGPGRQPRRCAADIDPGRIQTALNGMLAPEVVVRRRAGRADVRRPVLGPVARPTATRSSTGRSPDPFLARYAWWVPSRSTCRPAARRRPVRRRARLRRLLPGRRAGVDHGAAGGRVPLARPRRRRAAARDPGHGVLLADGALDRGHARRRRDGRRRAGEVMGMLRARDRAAAGRVAPPHGLCLWEVGY